MVRVGDSIPPGRDAAIQHAFEGATAKKQKKKKKKSKDDGAQGAALPKAIESTVEQTAIEVGDKVGLPPRVRFVQNCVRKKKEEGRGENTLVVGVDDMELLFKFFGYPL